MSYRSTFFVLLLALLVPVALAAPPGTDKPEAPTPKKGDGRPPLITEKAPPQVSPVVEKYLQLHRKGELKEYALIRLPTEPLPIRRVIPEWERARCLIVAITGQVFSPRTPEIPNSFAEIIRQALDVTDVLILIHEDHLEILRLLFQLLEKNHLEDRVVSEFAPTEQAAKAPAALAAKGSRRGFIHIVPLAVDSYWVRDYGPVFGEAKGGGLCVLDAIYRDVRAEDSQERLSALLSRDDSKRLRDDQVPTVLASLLTSRHRKESIHVVRPPLQLWGGDFFVDGQGNGFTSTNTLVMNGGVKEELNALLHAYYGLKQITYFEPLPGSTIKHIDMFFRPADERTFLVAEYPEDVATSIPVLDYMHKEARAILERNAQLLRTKFPNAEILRVPMPPLSFEKDIRDMLHASLDQLKKVALDPADWLLQGQLEQKSLPGTFEDYAIEFACQYGLADKSGRTSSTRSAYMREQVVRWKGIGNEANDMLNDMIRLREKINALSRKPPLTQSDRELLQKYQAEYRALQEEFALQTKYKTYLNSLYLKGASREKVLVPSYRRFRNLEPVVREVYQRAYPKAEVVFIPADELSEQFGAIHCVTCVIPDLPALSLIDSSK